MSLTELAHAGRLPVPTAHRLLGELCAWGAVERMADGRYQVGMRLWQIGSLAPQHRNLRAVALPFMEDLYEVTHENVQLAVRDGKRALYLDHIAGRRSVGTLTEVAGHLPLHATGVGKMILAFSDPELLEAVIADGLPRCTRYTITSRERLVEALNFARRTQLAFSMEEMTLGAASVAAPVFDANRCLCASLAIVVRASTDLRRLAPAVRAAALGMSRALAGMRNPMDETALAAAR